MIFRVIERTTNLYRNEFTYWNNKVLYCGINKTQARVNYLASKPNDFCNGFGETASETIVEEFEGYSKDVRSEELISSEVNEQAVKKTIAEIKKITSEKIVPISYVRLVRQGNELTVEVKIKNAWMNVIQDTSCDDFTHVVTVSDLSEVNDKFRM